MPAVVVHQGRFKVSYLDNSVGDQLINSFPVLYTTPSSSTAGQQMTSGLPSIILGNRLTVGQGGGGGATNITQLQQMPQTLATASTYNLISMPSSTTTTYITGNGAHLMTPSGSGMNSSTAYGMVSGGGGGGGGVVSVGSGMSFQPLFGDDLFSGTAVTEEGEEHDEEDVDNMDGTTGGFIIGAYGTDEEDGAMVEDVEGEVDDDHQLHLDTVVDLANMDSSEDEILEDSE